MLLLVYVGTAGAGSIEKLKAFISETRSAKANFTQSVRDAEGKKTQSASGTLQFSRPGRFRWTYDKPFQQLIVGDGEKLWVYDKELNQVTERKLDSALGSSPAALLAGDNEIERIYNLNAIGIKKGLDWLEATPINEDNLFAKVRMGFNKNTLETMELHDHFGQITVIQLSRLERNPKFSADHFTFTPPKGADVVSE
jgi:chaperone LolA